ncbi:MAGa7180 family putative nuclease [Mycoplasma procyoni]|uniref:MAGa7180 family putative nuclease n=1 Tax=Mycoplasma procyoni TaxID=568784 RepID=UPI00197B107A|nr:YqaJ viral recombinase family protein [Mycoplasma procyoni]MBN3534571.1 hypothetical protein [Mycoplasma procyoni]
MQRKKIQDFLNRKYFNTQHYEIDKIERVVRLKPEFHQMLLKQRGTNFGFKKIGGSSLGDVLLTDQWKSQFLAFCRMSKLDLPILDTKYIDAGVAIEPKVIDLISKKWNREVQTFNPVEYGYDYFRGKDDVIGGIPDGYIAQENVIIEIKTTQIKNLEKWESGDIPLNYLKQAQLYSYLMNSPHFIIVATFLEPEDYENPQDYDISKRIVKSFKFKTNEEQIKDDIVKIKDWYYKYTDSGVSPKYNERLDAALLEYLECKNMDEWRMLLEKWADEGKIDR